MAEAVLTKKDVALSLQMPDMAAVAERVVTWALELCARRMELDSPRAAAECVRQGNMIARMHCCSSMTRQLAESLGASDREIRAIYTPNHDVPDQSARYKGIVDEAMVKLLVWMRHRTAAFDLLVTDWDCALAQVCKDKLGTQGPTALLDVQVIEDADIEKHFGAGRRTRMATHHLAVYWLRTTNQVVDIVYAQSNA